TGPEVTGRPAASQSPFHPPSSRCSQCEGTGQSLDLPVRRPPDGGMKPGIVIVTGPPAAGKSTLTRALALSAKDMPAAHIHSDDAYAYIVRGYVEPWRPESRHQNAVVIEALAAGAVRFAQGGYLAVMDGVIGPWFLGPWREAAHRVRVDYVVLLPDEAAALARFSAREDHPLQEPAVVSQMWAAF